MERKASDSVRNVPYCARKAARVGAAPVTEDFLGGLVAEAGADGDLVAALGAAAAENGSSRLGLHAAEEAVGL
jgi:hypothetical protein